MRNARTATIGFVILLVLSSLSSLSDLFTIREINRRQDQARQQALVLADIERLRFFLEKKIAASQAYLLTGDERFRAQVSDMRANFDSLITNLHGTTITPEGFRLLEVIEQMEDEHQQALARIYERAADGPAANDQIRSFRETEANRDELYRLMNALAERKMERVRQENDRADRFAAQATRLAVALSALLLLTGIGLAVYLTRTIRERERMEQQLFEETVQQNAEAQAVISELREERDLARARLTNLLPKDR